jgi:RHS repeat-associated protein/uncharacterized repeat protein (TIGR01451 family)
MTDAAGNTTTYGYDATGQLVQVTLPDGQTITYVYNAAGDRTEVINNGTPTNYASNADNEITQVGSAIYTYDANRNLHTVTDAGGTTTYTYNDLNQLVSITNSDGSVQNFQYSPLGFMVGTSTTSGGSTSQTNYLIDPTGLGNVVASYNGSGSLIANYVYGLGLVSQTGPSGTGYYDFDLSGNTVGITGSSGAYVNEYRYLPFGEITTISAALPNPFTFAGQGGVMQMETNLFYMRARFYTPIGSQFASNDPFGLLGGDFNLRRYVGNSPITFYDPTGTSESGDPIPDPVGRSPIVKLPPKAGAPQPPRGSKVGDGGIVIDPNGTAHGIIIGGDYFPFDKPVRTRPSPLPFIIAIPIVLGAPWLAPLIPQIPLIPLIPKLFPKIPQFQPASFPLILPLFGQDPNALVGPASYGPQGFIQPGGTWSYTVEFENDGNAAAQDVTVTEQLDSNLDWSTFQLGSFGFGPVKVSIPAGLTQYQTTVSYQNVDGTSLNVLVSIDFNVQTGVLTVTFISLDPATGEAPTGVFDGFLPPDNSSGVGEGFVQYTVQPKAGLTTGAAITQQASVVFDINAPLNTAPDLNTIDSVPPTSTASPLPAHSSTSFTVSWSGSDDPGGSGIAYYDIYVSDNGGPFTLWQNHTTQTSAVFTGLAGHTYGFYSIAADNVGNREATPTGAEATTRVAATTTVTWINAAGGDWDNPSNWDLGRVPGPGDDVVINIPGITITHVSARADAIHSLTSQAFIMLSAGSLTIGGPSVLNATFTISGGTLFLINATLDGTGTLVNQGTVVAEGSSAIDVPLTTAVNSTLSVVGTNSGTTLTVASGFTNNGLIELTSRGFHKFVLLSPQRANTSFSAYFPGCSWFSLLP